MRVGAEENPHISRHRSAGPTGAGFERFELLPELLRAIVSAAFTEPRPIQLEAMPPGLAGRDVLGIAQTGTGKTAAFVLPILQRLLGEGRAGPRALVVTPTRELAAQVNAEFERLARYTPLTSAAVFGGVPVARQVQALRARPEVVVACPGRLLDLLNRGCLRLDRIEVLVLDEADHMLDMGFLPDVRRLLEALPRHRQTLLFSATMAREIRRLADSVLRKPAVVELAHSQPAETIDHAIFSVVEGQKVGVLERLLRDGAFRSAIVFLRTKRRTKRLAQQLDRGGHQVVTLQGNMSQSQRGRALRGFREGRFDVLVATDIAARGLDIAGVSHVVNFDVPNTPDAYTHRVGRTGRSGLAGMAFTLATPGDGEALRAIEKRFGKAIPRRSLEGLGLPGNAAHGGTEARHVSKPPRGRRPGRAPRLRAPGVPPIQEAAPAEPAVFGQGVTDRRCPQPPGVSESPPTPAENLATAQRRVP